MTGATCFAIAWQGQRNSLLINIVLWHFNVNKWKQHNWNLLYYCEDMHIDMCFPVWTYYCKDARFHSSFPVIIFVVVKSVLQLSCAYDLTKALCINAAVALHILLSFNFAKVILWRYSNVIAIHVVTFNKEMLVKLLYNIVSGCQISNKYFLSNTWPFKLLHKFSLKVIFLEYADLFVFDKLLFF